MRTGMRLCFLVSLLAAPALGADLSMPSGNLSVQQRKVACARTADGEYALLHGDALPLFLAYPTGTTLARWTSLLLGLVDTNRGAVAVPIRIVVARRVIRPHQGLIVLDLAHREGDGRHLR